MSYENIFLVISTSQSYSTILDSQINDRGKATQNYCQIEFFLSYLGILIPQRISLRNSENFIGKVHRVISKSQLSILLTGKGVSGPPKPRIRTLRYIIFFVNDEETHSYQYGNFQNAGIYRPLNPQNNHTKRNLRNNKAIWFSLLLISVAARRIVGCIFARIVFLLTLRHMHQSGL